MKEEEIMQMGEEEIIQKLSELYKGECTDPKTLCLATFRDFDMNADNWHDHERLKGRLFQICHERGDEWTKIQS